MKTEPDAFSIDDLERKGTEHWDGVRNFQARNMMRDEMRAGDGVLFYHSRAKPPGVAGVARVARRGYPDHTQFDPRSKYYDPTADADDPRWFMVDVAFGEKFAEVVPLDMLKVTSGLEQMMVIRKGMRLSVQPVSKQEFAIVRRIGRKMRQD